MLLAVTSLLTTAPAATVAISPTVTPGRIVAPAPTQATFGRCPYPHFKSDKLG